MRKNKKKQRSGDTDSRKGVMFAAKGRLETQYGGSGKLAKIHPGPWAWDDFGILKDAKGKPIPGAQQVRAAS